MKLLRRLVHGLQLQHLAAALTTTFVLVQVAEGIAGTTFGLFWIRAGFAAFFATWLASRTHSNALRAAIALMAILAVTVYWDHEFHEPPAVPHVGPEAGETGGRSPPTMGGSKMRAGDVVGVGRFHGHVFHPRSALVFDDDTGLSIHLYDRVYGCNDSQDSYLELQGIELDINPGVPIQRMFKIVPGHAISGTTATYTIISASSDVQNAPAQLRMSVRVLPNAKVWIGLASLRWPNENATFHGSFSAIVCGFSG